MQLKSHTLVPEREFQEIRYELRPALDPSGVPVDGLFNAWIWLDNPGQYNSYTTDAVKELILAFRQASMDRRVRKGNVSGWRCASPGGTNS